MDKKKALNSMWVIIFAVAVYPILYYYFSTYSNISFLPKIPKQGFIQVYFSSPVLIILGIYKLFDKSKTIGFISITIGVVWLLAIINELIMK